MVFVSRPSGPSCRGTRMWLLHHGQRAWRCLRLHIKLQRTSPVLWRWAKSLLGRNKILLKAVSQLIGILDVVQEFRQLFEVEVGLKQDLKNCFLGLTTLDKLRAQQASRMMTIKAIEANRKLLYMQTNSRRQKNYIHSLHTSSGAYYTHDDKAELLFDHYSSHFGAPQ